MSKQFTNVTVTAKANVYFGGKVVSHTIHAANQSKTTLGLIYPGEFRFNTVAPEGMEITAGACRVKLAGETTWAPYSAGSVFEIPGNSHFDIAVDEGIAEYICIYK